VTLNQALALVKSGKERGAEKKAHYLVSGFEPLHLKTFIQAHFLQRLPENDIDILNGLYGDFSGNLALAAQSSALGAVAVLEGSDIDPRLGLRSSGGWAEEIKPDILSGADQRLARIERSVAEVARKMPVVFVAPCLPMLPLGNTIRSQSSVMELEIEQRIGSFLLRISRLPGVRIVDRSRLGRIPVEDRLDVRFELLAGFPYTVPFADLMAGAVTEVLYPCPPKKGLITDLDDTLWAGIVGEIGADKVSWQQESHSQAHGLYQQMLGHLASCGVLLAVCSKNEMAAAEAGLSRQDLFLKKESFFPVCANWGPKSLSVGIILRTWNIGEEAVVFVDDSPMELEEVKSAFPGIECREFPRKDPSKLWNLLGELRDLFGKPVIMAEDGLRQTSIRASAMIQEAGESAESSEFLLSLGATVSLDWRLDPSDKRPLELINKTNQFNLNGRRITEGEWQRRIDQPDSVLAVVSYADRFGPLGKVAVVLGRKLGTTVRVAQWVMSCRAFSRRLEHQTLESLFRETSAEALEFDFEPTGKNNPLQEFFRSVGIGADADGTYRISRADFAAQAMVLPHRVIDLRK
jgi:FkbH-like protein